MRTVLHSRGYRKMNGWARPRHYLRGPVSGLGQDPDLLDIAAGIPIDTSQGSGYIDSSGPLDNLPIDMTNPGAPLETVAPFSTIAPLPNYATPPPSSTPSAIAKLNAAVNAATSPYGQAVPTVAATGVSQNVFWALGIGAVALALFSHAGGGAKKRGRR